MQLAQPFDFRWVRFVVATCLVLLIWGGLNPAQRVRAQEMLDTDLLIVGGNEAAVAAAVEAVRAGVNKLLIVNDIDWLGGQFSAEAVGAIDEWTVVGGKRTNFPRSGLFLEIMEQIHAHNAQYYGKGRPGNAWTASDTVEPRVAHDLFTNLLATAAQQRPSVRLLRRSDLRPVAARFNSNQATVEFAATDASHDHVKLVVRAALVIDCSDWGDVIRLAGAEYFAGADPRDRFDEPSAPEHPTEPERNEMNPLSYCLVARATAEPSPLTKPEHYDERRYFGATNATPAQFATLGWPTKALYLNVPPFIDNDYPLGIYSQKQSVYTQRRLVDAEHNQLPTPHDVLLFNWVVQDYPLYNFPQWVVDALERLETGAARKNLVNMTHHQRQVVFHDAKQHSLGMLYFLQQLPDGVGAERFRKLSLTSEFGTADRLPPKPYLREGLRLHALSMLREQDIRTPHPEPRWAKIMPHDGLFGFQFNIDFHPTRRQFLHDDPRGPWVLIHTPTRNWSTHTDRTMLAARSLVPVRVDRLIGSSKNIGLTSITSAALRLHGQMMHCGQASGALAALCLEKNLQPRQIVAQSEWIDLLQLRLATGNSRHPGVLLWPYHDLKPQDKHFVAANMLAVRHILPPLPDSIDFQPHRKVTQGELIAVLQRLAASLTGTRPNLADWSGSLARDEPALSSTLGSGLVHLQLTHGLRQPETELTRATLAIAVWDAIQKEPRRWPTTPCYLDIGHDSDDDGQEDRLDPLPFDRDNNNVPDHLEHNASRP